MTRTQLGLASHDLTSRAPPAALASRASRNVTVVRLSLVLLIGPWAGCSSEANGSGGPAGGGQAGGGQAGDAQAGDATAGDAQAGDASGRTTAFGPFLQAYASPGADYVKAMTTDHAGHVLVATLFTGTITVGAAGETLVSRGAIDSGIVAYDPATGRVVNAFSFGGSGNTIPHGIAVDGANDRFVIGYSRAAGGPGVADYDPAASPDGRIDFSGGEKPFVAKYTPSGALVWARMFDASDGTGASTYSRAWDVAVDAAGDVYVVGHFRNTMDLDPGPGSFTVASTAGSTDLFVAKLSGTGDFIYGFALGGPGADAGVEGTAVSPGGTGNTSIAVHGGKLFVQGTFELTASVAGTSARTAASEVTSAGAADLFLARFDAETGAFERSVVLGNASAESSAPGALRVDAAGNLLLAARTNGAVDWGGSAGSDLRDAVGSAVVVASFDGALSLRWAARLASTAGNDGAHRVVPDGRGGIFVAGWHNGITDFDPGPGTLERASAATDPSGLDLYLIKLRDNGVDASVVWANALNATAAHTTTGIAAGLAVDPSGHAWVGGQFFVETDFDPGSDTALLQVAGVSDGFVARYRGDTGAAR